MQQPFLKVFLAGVFVASILSFTQCKTNGSGNCEIDSLAVYTKYRNDHFGRKDSLGRIINDSLRKVINGASTNDIIDLVSILELFEADSLTKAIGDGEEVPFMRADNCTSAFKDLMNRRGFPDTDPADPTDMGKLTLTETFKGDGLLKWLQDSKAAGATEIDIRFGKYNPDFLNWRFPQTADAGEIRKRLGRITVFLYPLRRTGNTTTLVGTKAYDLGNLHP